MSTGKVVALFIAIPFALISLACGGCMMMMFLTAATRPVDKAPMAQANARAEMNLVPLIDDAQGRMNRAFPGATFTDDKGNSFLGFSFSHHQSGTQHEISGLCTASGKTHRYSALYEVPNRDVSKATFISITVDGLTVKADVPTTEADQLKAKADRTVRESRKVVEEMRAKVEQQRQRLKSQEESFRESLKLSREPQSGTQEPTSERSREETLNTNPP